MTFRLRLTDKCYISTLLHNAHFLILSLKCVSVSILARKVRSLYNISLSMQDIFNSYTLACISLVGNQHYF